MKNRLLKVYGTDASCFSKSPKRVAFPKSVEEARKEVLNSRFLIPRGGASGFSGGVVPVLGEETIVDLSKMNKIESLDLNKMEVLVQAGTVLGDLNLFLKDFGMEFPVDILSRDIATIGGIIANDSYGLRAERYGRASKWIKWIEVIDFNGKVRRVGPTEISDYAGMEGTTGLIVRACLKLNRIPKRSIEILKFKDFHALIEKVSNLKRRSDVSIIEVYSPHISQGIGLEEEFSLLVEFEGKSGGNISAETIQEKVYPFVSTEGYTRIEDVKVFLNSMNKLMPFFEKNKIPFFGQISVGIIHPCFNEDSSKKIPDFIRSVQRMGGSCFGTFGRGILKRGFIAQIDKNIISNVFNRRNPDRKFNPGKIIPYG